MKFLSWQNHRALVLRPGPTRDEVPDLGPYGSWVEGDKPRARPLATQACFQDAAVSQEVREIARSQSRSPDAAICVAGSLLPRRCRREL